MHEMRAAVLQSASRAGGRKLGRGEDGARGLQVNISGVLVCSSSSSSGALVGFGLQPITKQPITNQPASLPMEAYALGARTRLAASRPLPRLSSPCIPPAQGLTHWAADRLVDAAAGDGGADDAAPFALDRRPAAAAAGLGAS